MTFDRTDDGAALERLRDILDAYGGDPVRWPDAERDPALALIARSAEARRLQDAARDLDHALDLLPAAEPSGALADRIVSAALRTPQTAPVDRRVASIADARLRRATRRPRPLLLAALPLAAAAALALWIARGGEAERGAAVAPTTTTTGAEVTIADLGSYALPGDALLELSVVDDVYDTEPWRGCSDGDLGCLSGDTLPLEPVSQTNPAKEVRLLS